MISSGVSATTWITSIEILEKTGISRATLNNYIKMGIIPRPVVRKPDLSNSRAKKIGYFPQNVIDRILTVQQMKDEGKAMNTIVKTFTENDPIKQLNASETNTENGFRQSIDKMSSIKPEEIPSVTADNVNKYFCGIEGFKLTINDVQCPAFLINNKFEIEWINREAEAKIFNLEVALIRDSSDRNIFKLFSKMGFLADNNINKDFVKYMMKFVKHKYERNLLIKLYNGIRGKEVVFLENIYDVVEPIFSDSLHETYLNILGIDNETTSYHAYHIVFREGILCLFSPIDSIFQGIVELLSSRGKIIHDLLRQRMPSLVSFCVLVADLQDSSRICAELPPEEYFELIQDIWKCMDGSFQKFYGTYGKHVGDGMVYYFLKDKDDDYIMNSIYCALELREKMKKLNMEWTVRKGWLNDLYLNIGINEGQEYFGNIPSSPNIEFTALGDSVNYAGRLSDLARFGSIWTTKNLLNRLDMDMRKKIKFGVKHKDHDREIFIENMFSRVMDILRPDEPNYSKFMDIATLAIAEIIGAFPSAGGF
jgi:class 3 adenylate cyclase